MTPDEIRRSWDDDDTPRSHFPTAPFTQPRADRDAELVAYDQLSRENVELWAEVERLTSPACSECGGLPVTCAAAPVKCCPDCSGPTHQALVAGRREARLDALVADLRGLADKPVNRDDVVRLVPPLSVNGRADTYVSQHALRAVLDKHAGEQP
jgi:hypothetical protein